MLLTVSACASSLPSNFEYKTSLRGEQGFIGRADRVKAAETVLGAGTVVDPASALRSALPDADIKVRKWGLRYLKKDWERYQIVMDADIRRNDNTFKCRQVSTNEPNNAPTLETLLADDGAQIQKELDRLVAVCVRQFNDLT